MSVVFGLQVSNSGSVSGTRRASKSLLRSLGAKPISSRRRRLRFLQEMSEGAEFLVTLLETLGDRERLQLFELFNQTLFDRLRNGFGIVVRSAKGFGNRFVHQTKLQQVLCSNLERFRCLGRRGAILPEDRRTT